MRTSLHALFIAASVVFAFAVIISTSNPKVEASIYLGSSIYMDETSAVKIQDNGSVRKFAVNVYSVDENNNVKESSIIWFYYSPSDNPNNNSLNQNARYSWDNFQNWDWFVTDNSSPMGKAFRIAWQYALGYSYT